MSEENSELTESSFNIWFQETVSFCLSKIQPAFDIPKNKVDYVGFHLSAKTDRDRKQLKTKRETNVTLKFIYFFP